MTPPILTDDEIAAICRPLVQHAARIRYLRRLRVPVVVRPDGSPMVKRSDWERATLGQDGATPQPAASQAAGAQPRWSRAAR